MKPRIPYTKPSITDLEVRYATDAAANGWGERCYEYIDRFESAFKDHLGVKYAVATSSCTGALHMGMAALGIGHGDEVILADANWIATASPIVHLGARPVFVDILPETWCIDPDHAEAAITPRTKAIIAVHLYGNLCDMDRLGAISRKYGIPVIEDAAEAIGSVWHGRRAGSIGAFGTFSFHGTKTITTGEGGMLVTNDDTLFETVLTLSNHGRARTETKQFWPEMVGFKFKMSNLQAALGLGQMERVEELVLEKRRIFHAYSEQLASEADLVMNPEPQGTTNGYWMPTVVFQNSEKELRNIAVRAFASENIDARVFFWPLTSTPPFRGLVPAEIASKVASRAINLPSFYGIEPSHIDRVVAVIKKLAS